MDLHFRFVKDAAIGCFVGLGVLILGFGENYLLTAHNTKLKLFIFFLNSHFTSSSIVAPKLFSFLYLISVHNYEMNNQT